MADRIQLNVRTVGVLAARPRAAFSHILFDPIHDCNLHCVYCHNNRETTPFSYDEFVRFLDHNVESVDFFQHGCAMEPTLDPRLTDFMVAFAERFPRPKDGVRLQTNGLLLHRHDPERMRAGGLTMLTVSMDTVDAEAFKSLRGGSSPRKVQANIAAFRAALPEVKVALLMTVTSENIAAVDDLVQYAISAGVAFVELRQMFYFRFNNVVDHSRMPGLLVDDTAFLEMAERVKQHYLGQMRFFVLPASKSVPEARSMRAASYGLGKAPAVAADGGVVRFGMS